MKIVISDTNIETFSGTSAKGKPYNARLQFAMVHLDDGQVLKAKFRLGPDDQPYPRGEYRLSDASWHCDERGELGLKQFGVSLTPIKPDGKAAA